MLLFFIVFAAKQQMPSIIVSHLYKQFTYQTFAFHFQFLLNCFLSCGPILTGYFMSWKPDIWTSYTDGDELEHDITLLLKVFNGI